MKLYLKEVKRVIDKKLNKNLIAIIILYVIVFAFLSFCFSTKKINASSSTINFQGKIVDKTTGINVVSGSPACVVSGASNDTCDFRANIYDASSGGNLLWREPHSNKEIGNYGGIFNLKLNSVCNSWTSPSGSCSGTGVDWSSATTFYLEIQIDTDGDGDFATGGGDTIETFSRKEIDSAPYSQYAKNAGTLNGISDTGFIKYSPSSTQSTTSTNSLINLTSTASSATNPLILVNENGSGTPDLLNLQVGGSKVFTVGNDGRLRIGTTADISNYYIDAYRTWTGSGTTKFSILNSYGNLSGNAGSSGLYAINATADIAPGTGNTLNIGTGLYSITKLTSAGTLTNAYALVAQTQNTSTGTITDSRGLSILNPTNSGGGSITTNYGIYIQNQTAGSSDYGIYIEGGDTRAIWVNSGTSQFVGNVNVGRYDTDIGNINLFGDSNEEGGQIQFYTAANYDDIIDYFLVDIYKQDFRIITPESAASAFILNGVTGNLGLGTYSDDHAGVKLVKSLSGSLEQYNLQSLFTSTGANTASSYGIYSQVYAEPGTSNTIANAYGVNSIAQLNSAGTVTNAIGLRGVVSNSSTGTITNAMGLRIGSATNSGGGTLTNNYGIYVNSQTAGSTDYGIYLAGADNYALYSVSGATYLGGSLMANSLGCNNSYQNTDGAGDNTINVTSNSCVFDLRKNTGTTNTSSTTIYNLTGVNDVDGSILFIYTRVVKGATANARKQQVDVQINGVAISSIQSNNGSTTTGSTNEDESYIAIKTSGTWQTISLSNDTPNPTAADVAEYIPGETDLLPGHIVAIDKTRDEYVIKSSREYQDEVVGVYSTEPYLINTTERGNIPLALAGRVPVFVSTINGEINRGDAITTSVIPGYGMLSNKSGQIIGRAMESSSNLSSQLTNNNCPVEYQNQQDVEGNLIKCGKILVFLGIKWEEKPLLKENRIESTNLSSISELLNQQIDLSENISTADSSVQIGDVIKLNKDSLIEKAGGIQKTYDKEIYGVIGSNSLIYLNNWKQQAFSDYPVVSSGRSPVKITLENGNIKKGDYLVASSKPGFAMKATEGGMIIGRALEDFPNENFIQGDSNLAASLLTKNKQSALALISAMNLRNELTNNQADEAISYVNAIFSSSNLNENEARIIMQVNPGFLPGEYFGLAKNSVNVIDSQENNIGDLFSFVDSTLVLNSNLEIRGAIVANKYAAPKLEDLVVQINDNNLFKIIDSVNSVIFAVNSSGKITLKEGSGSSTGEAIILPGTTEIFVDNSSVTSNSRIQLTPDQLVTFRVKNKIENQGFIIEIDKVLEQQVKFEYILIN